MKIGLIFTSYGMPEYLNNALSVWIKAKSHFDLKIAVVSMPFKDFVDCNDVESHAILSDLLSKKNIDYLITEPKYISEYDARDLALKKLLKEKCDIIGQWDGDEFTNLKEITGIISFIENNRDITWFRGSYKNYVFDTNTYFVEPFNPPRWYRNTCLNYQLSKFAYDNDIYYTNVQTGEIKPHSMFASMTIPQSIAFTPHHSWLDNERTRKKIAYQKIRWGDDGCMFSIINNKLDWNKDFFKKNNLYLPNIAKDK